MGTGIVFFDKETGPISPSAGDGILKANNVGKIGKFALRFLFQLSYSSEHVKIQSAHALGSNNINNFATY